jgi:5'-3' exoribonuclease 2
LTTAEERQDRSEKRRKIERENQQSNSQRNSAQNHSQLSAGGGKTHRNGVEYVEVNANGSTAATSSSSTGLPSKPTWSAGEADKESEKAAAPAPVAITGAMVNSNASIVANRKALRLANLSAADMIKAELAASASGEGELAVPEEKNAVEDAEKEDSKALEEEQKAENAGQAEAEKNAKAAAKLKAELLGAPATAEEETSPRGTKRPAPPEAPSAEGDEAVEEEANDEDEDAEVNAFLTDSLLPPKPSLIAGLDVAQPPPLKLMGNNVVEQDDTVKCVLLSLLSTLW